MMLNLTVAVGTLNGLIFFANVVDANGNVFTSSVNFLSLPILWLNLELEFDSCFFKGMDSYWKMWLQLAFPVYVIFLVMIVIIVSDHSIRFSHLIARRNPVATLATLILLSYTKLLRTVITVFSFATLDYPDGSHVKVWLPDASVDYLSEKHIALFVIILIFGIAYTLFLFSWQWLLFYQDKKLFKWARNQKLCHFFEPYHAPYSIKHRYWTGLLLLARVSLYLVFALNVSSDSGVNLLAIIVLGSGLLFLKGICSQLYKSKIVDMFETVSYFNILTVSGAELFSLESRDGQTLIAYFTVLTTVIQLLAVLAYHMLTEVFMKLWKKLNSRRDVNTAEEPLLDFPPTNTINIGSQTNAVEPTVTVINGVPHREGLESGASIGENGNSECQSGALEMRDDEDGVSCISDESTAPLLVEDDK